MSFIYIIYYLLNKMTLKNLIVFYTWVMFGYCLMIEKIKTWDKKKTKTNLCLIIIYKIK
jgi:phosphatidylserine synthase